MCASQLAAAGRNCGAGGMTAAGHSANGAVAPLAIARVMPPSPRAISANQLITHVSAIGFATALSARALDPLIPTIAHHLAVDAASVALLSTAFALPFAFVQPILGPLADMVGKIRLMVTCLAVVIIVSCVSALAQSFAVLMLARIVCGMATGGIFPVGLARAAGGDRALVGNHHRRQPDRGRLCRPGRGFAGLARGVLDHRRLRRCRLAQCLA